MNGAMVKYVYMSAYCASVSRFKWQCNEVKIVVN